ncbi:hypothetical protein BDV96DRAFT_509609, partial [Lophiotrema nucula]
GDTALAGQPELNIPSHFFPPHTEDRTIWFKGIYLSIVNKKTNDTKTHIDNQIATTKYRPHKVPAGYTTYLRGASVYFIS